MRARARTIVKATTLLVIAEVVAALILALVASFAFGTWSRGPTVLPGGYRSTPATCEFSVPRSYDDQWTLFGGVGSLLLVANTIGLGWSYVRRRTRLAERIWRQALRAPADGAPGTVVRCDVELAPTPDGLDWQIADASGAVHVQPRDVEAFELDAAGHLSHRVRGVHRTATLIGVVEHGGSTAPHRASRYLRPLPELGRVLWIVPPPAEAGT